MKNYDKIKELVTRSKSEINNYIHRIIKFIYNKSV